MLSCIWLFATSWTVAHEAPLFTDFSRQEYWSRLPFLPPGDLFDPGIEPTSQVLAGEFFTNAPPGKPVSVQKDIKRAHTTESSMYMSASWVLQIRCRDSKSSAQDHTAAKKRNQDQNSTAPSFFKKSTLLSHIQDLGLYNVLTNCLKTGSPYERASESEATHWGGFEGEASGPRSVK